MNTDKNLLLGVLALNSDLIDGRQFIDACVLWTSQKKTTLLDLMINRGWIVEADKVHLEYFLERNLKRHNGDPKASLAAIPDGLKRSLDALNDPDIHQSLAGLSRHGRKPVEETVVHAPRSDERYQLTKLHAVGGIGRIWLAHDQTLDRDVALKDIRPELGNAPDLCMRFVQEARITGQLEHPGIVPVYELAQRSDGRGPYYTMRFVKGCTLASEARDFHESRTAGSATISELLPLLNAFVTVCKTIAYAHSQGIIHRDLKGQNVMVGDFGEVVVLDWGLAKQISAKEPAARQSGDDIKPTNSSLTIHGQAVGTPAYMAPEQASGRLEQINHLTDVYGLGALLYELLTGTPPFTGSDTAEVLHRIQHAELMPPMQVWPEVPEPLDLACRRALAKDPGRRFASAVEFGQAVEQWQEIERRRTRTALAASEALYHSLVETIPMNVWRKDANGRFLFANKGFCKATGRTLEQLLGKTDFDVFPAVSAEKYQRDDTHIMETGQTIDVLEEHHTADGETLFVRVVKLPIRDAHGQIVGTQGIFWDITDRKRLEESLGQTTEELMRVRQQLALAKDTNQ